MAAFSGGPVRKAVGPLARVLSAAVRKWIPPVDYTAPAVRRVVGVVLQLGARCAGSTATAVRA
jgi:hypothetical protein